MNIEFFFSVILCNPGIPHITDCVMAEIEKLGMKYRVALRYNLLNIKWHWGHENILFLYKFYCVLFFEYIITLFSCFVFAG